ncbi:PLDc N-terminal domain-containing protein [uncultured Microbacterium sp.]|uniref:PLDc N-terminal domain-containing protein n=1 Tax=uncultured Microbacterium sp. TaxID=191216 RepID=UPI0028DC963A|nr:PLDc N-terminal domain-containing protein [uncultured Microbacterium sp.]
MVVNPLIPSIYDIVFGCIWVAVAALAVVAFISALRDRRVTGIPFVLWALLIWFVPVLGPIAWFVRRPRPAPPAPASGRTNGSSEA